MTTQLPEGRFLQGYWGVTTRLVKKTGDWEMDLLKLKEVCPTLREP